MKKLLPLALLLALGLFTGCKKEEPAGGAAPAGGAPAGGAPAESHPAEQQPANP
jgi:hypothetical protein